MVDVRDDIRRREHYAPAALVACIFAEIHRNKEEHPEPFTMDDFMLMDGENVEAAEPMSDNERMFHKLRALVVHMGGRDETGGVEIQVLG